MGVHGLTTFLRENRSSLSKTIVFSQQDAQVIPLVVDGWSFIYKVLEDSGLPWVYGGEYEAFADIVIKIVKAWISVSLHPIFVFDGSTPQEKFRTAIQRRNEARIQQSLLFFRTSAASRNTRRFLNETRIIPPLALAVCVHALLSFQNCVDGEVPQDYRGPEQAGPIEVYFADEEADPYAVELAGRLGAYVTGRDSDFVVLNSEGYLGYVPLEEMSWLTPDVDDEQHVRDEVNDGFQSVKKKKRVAAERTNNSGIIPPESMELSLSASLYTPASLAQYLSLPVSVLPLLGALVGNDYTLQPGDRPTYGTNPKAIQGLLFERRLTNSQRITHASATLSTLLHGQRGKGKQKKPKSVMELIEMTVGALALSSGAPSALVGPEQQAALVETIVEGTLPYAMPLRPSEDAFLSSTVCALHLPEECRLVARMDRSGLDSTFSAYAETISALYLSAYRQGKFSPSLTDIFSTWTFWPDIFLENPDTEAVTRSISRYVRQFAYALLEDGAVLPAPPTDDEENDADAGENLDTNMEDPDELIDVVEDANEEYDYEDDISSDVGKLRGELMQLQFDDEMDRASSSFDNSNFTEGDSVNESAAGSSSARSPVPLSRPTVMKRRMHAQHKVVTEYVRRGARVVAEEVEVCALHELFTEAMSDEGELKTMPLQLRPETERFDALCRVFHANTQDILGLYSEDRMPVLALRLVVHRMHQRAAEAPNSKERQLGKWTRREARSFLASLSRTGSDVSTDPPAEISERSIQLTAQILTALESIEHLVQILFLTDAIPDCAPRFSGLRFHSLLALKEEIDVREDAWLALVNGLDACFMEERQSKRAKRRVSQNGSGAKSDSPVNMRGKIATTGSLYSILADISS